MEFPQLAAHINTAGISSFASQLPYGLFIMDLHSRYAFMNPIAVNNLGVESPDIYFGKSHHDVDVPSVALAHVYTQHDRDVVKTFQTLYHVGRFYLSGKAAMTAYVLRSPFYIDNKMVGIMVTYHDIGHINMLNYSLLNYHLEKDLCVDAVDHQFDYRIRQYIPNMDITARESEVLFYTLRGKTSTDIANICHISPRTVEKHLQNMRCKMNVSNKADLIDTAIAQGLANVIPPSLFARWRKSSLIK